MEQHEVAATASKWLLENTDKLREKMAVLKLRDEPVPLPGDKFFAKYHDEL